MEECKDNRINFKLIHPFTLCVIGPTQAGKSRLVLEIIERANEIISETIDKIIYVYTEDQPLFHQFKKNTLKSSLLLTWRMHRQLAEMKTHL